GPTCFPPVSKGSRSMKTAACTARRASSDSPPACPPRRRDAPSCEGTHHDPATAPYTAPSPPRAPGPAAHRNREQPRGRGPDRRNDVRRALEHHLECGQVEHGG